MDEKLLRQVIDAIAASGVFATAAQINALAADIKQRAVAPAGNAFSISRAIRGLRAMKNNPLVPDSAEADAKYVQDTMQRALTTGAVPGSYLVPTIQSDRLIELISDAGALRRIGPMVWPMVGVQNMNVPVATGTPTVEWLGQNTAQTASDPNFGQVALSLKTARSLTAIPNELLATSTPAVDAAIERLIAIGFATKEDAAFFATSSQSNGPTSVYAVSGTTTRLVGGSANGGAITYGDLLGLMADAFAQGAMPPFVFAMHPTVWFTKVLNIKDTTSRPIIQEPVRGDDSAVVARLFGYPVVLSSQIPVNQTNGSGSDQSYILFTNPNYIQLGDSGALEIAYSAERYFDANQTAVRGVRRMDFGYGPANGICILKGVDTV